MEFDDTIQNYTAISNYIQRQNKSDFIILEKVYYHGNITEPITARYFNVSFEVICFGALDSSMNTRIWFDIPFYDFEDENTMATLIFDRIKQEWQNLLAYNEVWMHL